EYRLDQILGTLGSTLGIPVQSVDSEHFLSKRLELEAFFKGKKTYLMERFYRHMRVKYNILMDESSQDPVGGQWNYDHDNRKKLPKNIQIPQPMHFYRKVEEIINLLEKEGVQTIGKVDPERFNWPISRAESLELLEHFLQIRLSNFGTYQDALTDRSYLVFHSKLSFSMNTKMLSPLEVIRAAEAYWRKRQDSIDIAQVEGFIRQILGWREYMRGIYWAKMPEYAELNYFNHQEDLPDWFWTGETNMGCMKIAIGQSLDYAYAHHIQRLMVTGNFALLLGVHPDQVDEWYLGIYMDALEWVEITNTRGMSQFADGGIVGTKPYVSSANYLVKMGGHCKDCKYNPKKRYGEDACPFNALYWDFFDRHTDKLSRNPRIGFAYRNLNRMDSEEKAKIIEHAGWIKAHKHEL
ncbi:MAG: cryptochrome/photolyase family protein, partial [Bacteroidota bacterium]